MAQLSRPVTWVQSIRWFDYCSVIIIIIIMSSFFVSFQLQTKLVISLFNNTEVRRTRIIRWSRPVTWVQMCWLALFRFSFYYYYFPYVLFSF